MVYNGILMETIGISMMVSIGFLLFFLAGKNAGKAKNLCELKDFSEIQEDSLTVQDKQGTHEQLSLNKKTSVDHSGNNIVLRIKGM